ncbi:MAG: hypothetical protein AAGF11_42195 [Myxococcota bacterium]
MIHVIHYDLDAKADAWYVDLRTKHDDAGRADQELYKIRLIRFGEGFGGCRALHRR